MQKVKDLTQGPILGNLIRLSLPIIGTSFMQMAYNLTDMMWLGQMGSGAVAAVGAASFFSWFGISILLITRIGAEVGVAQSIGRRDLNGAARYARHAIVWALILIGLYMTITLLLTMAMMAAGLDLVSAFGAVQATINLCGPGLGKVAVSFSEVNDAVKWLGTLAMLIGRLEIFTLLILFLPAYWRN